ncbi:MAG: ANTAR domain-containing protein [Actinobacteria bacterium]|nr:ANTAR domain-containing protein [Actinomycetota bacterium]
MTVDLTVATPTAPVQRFDVLVQPDELLERVRTAECKAANLERALASNRRIGIAIGILLCQRQVTDEQAFAILRAHSQRGNGKVREVAEAVIVNGRL